MVSIVETHKRIYACLQFGVTHSLCTSNNTKRKRDENCGKGGAFTLRSVYRKLKTVLDIMSVERSLVSLFHFASNTFGLPTENTVASKSWPPRLSALRDKNTHAC